MVLWCPSAGGTRNLGSLTFVTRYTVHARDRLSRIHDPKPLKTPQFLVRRRFTIGVPTMSCNNRSATSDPGQDQTLSLR